MIFSYDFYKDYFLMNNLQICRYLCFCTNLQNWYFFGKKQNKNITGNLLQPSEWLWLRILGLCTYHSEKPSAYSCLIKGITNALLCEVYSCSTTWNVINKIRRWDNLQQIYPELEIDSRSTLFFTPLDNFVTCLCSSRFLTCRRT